MTNNGQRTDKGVIIITNDTYLDFVISIINFDIVKTTALVSLNGLEKVPAKLPVYTYDYLPEVIGNFSFDYIFVMSGLDSTDIKIKEHLIKLGVSKNKIIFLFYMLANEQIGLINVVKSYLTGKFPCQSFITGMSYAYHSIAENYYDASVLNLSAPSQDLYYDYQIAKLILENTEHKFSYGVIGLAPYSFHYDLSLSSGNDYVLSYYNCTKKTHHYPKNVFEMLNNNYFTFTNRIDSNLDYYREYKESFVKKNSRIIDTMGQISARERAEQWSNKFYPETLFENKTIFEEYLNLCLSHDVKPILIVFPVTDVYKRWFSKKVLDGFYLIIEEFRKKYDFLFLDYYSSNLFG